MTKPNLTKFWKYQSEGNDFVILDTTKGKAPNASSIRRLCHRVLGIGANGLIAMAKTPQGWSWRFFNEDGSSADMCGNGAKCAALWLKTRGEPRKKSWDWQSKLGPVHAEADGAKLIWARWPIPGNKPNQAIIAELDDILEGLNERGLAYFALINAGIPHVVLINHESWTSTDRSALNQQLRHHPAFGKPGANVTWHSLSTGESVTFERGVEAETLACGTGAIAIFMALEDMGRTKGQAKLRFPGGTLLVKRDKSLALWLGGKPEEVFSGQF